METVLRTVYESYLTYSGLRVLIQFHRPCDLYGKCYRYKLRVYEGRQELRPLPITFFIELFGEKEEYNPGQPDVRRICLEVHREVAPFPRPAAYWVSGPSKIAENVLTEVKSGMRSIVAPLLRNEYPELWVWWDSKGWIHTYWDPMEERRNYL